MSAINEEVPQSELDRYGIERVPAHVFVWGGYRYSNARDAIAAAQARRYTVSRAILLSLNERQVREKCLEANVGVSTIKGLRDGGVRLVCISGQGTELIRKTFGAHLLVGRELLSGDRSGAGVLAHS